MQTVRVQGNGPEHHCLVLTWRHKKLQLVSYMVFLTFSPEELSTLEQAVSCYVVRSERDIDSDFLSLEKLGQGAFGEVSLAEFRQPDYGSRKRFTVQGDEVEDASNEKVAVKTIDKAKIQGIDLGPQSLINEIRVHWALEQCDAVLKLLRIYENSSSVMLVLEYQPKGSLMKTLKNQTRFTEHEVRVIME